MDSLKFVEISTALTRGGHSLKLVKQRCRVDVRKFFFAHRVVDIWNNLDEKIVARDANNSFKNKLDKFLYGQGFI